MGRGKGKKSEEQRTEVVKNIGLTQADENSKEVFTPKEAADVGEEPGFAEGLSAEGLTYVSLDEEEQAVEEIPVEQEPGFAEGLSAEGLTYVSLDEEEQAVEEEVGFAKGLSAEGLTYVSLDEEEQAVQDASVKESEQGNLVQNIQLTDEAGLKQEMDFAEEAEKAGLVYVDLQESGAELLYETLNEKVEEELAVLHLNERLEQEIDCSSIQEEEEQMDINEVEEVVDEQQEEEELYGEERISFFSRFSLMDRVLVATGLVIILLSVVTITAFWGKRTYLGQIEALALVGEQLETVGIIGEDMLVAVADTKKAMEETARIEQEWLKLQEEERKREEEQKKEEEKQEQERKINVSMKLSSVQKDLKIKFLDKSTGKLVKNVLFEVKIKDPSGKTYGYKDEDKDGIIYLTKLAGGNYAVSMVELAAQEKYQFSTKAEEIKVKEDIAYQKVDVSDEIKKETEVDLSKEDTSAKVETEGELKDTIEWVETNKTETGQGTNYIEIPKSEIADPAIRAGLDRLRSFVFTAEVTQTQTANQENASNNGTQPQEGVSEKEKNEQSGSQESLAGNTQTGEGETGQTGEAKPENEGSQTVQPEQKPEDQPEQKPESQPEQKPEQKPEGQLEQKPEQKPEGQPEQKPEGQPEQNGSSQETNSENPQQPQEIAVAEVVLNQTTLTLEEGTIVGLTATVKPAEATNKSLQWSSSAEDIVKVDGQGMVTAIKPGEASITVKAGEKTAVCTIKVTAKPVETTVTLNPTEASLKVGENLVLQAAVNPGGKAVSWASSNPAVAEVNQGKVTAKAAGETIITVSVEGKSASCKITVTAQYDPAQDRSTPLKSKDGRQVYCLVNGQYVEAKVADYYQASSFFVQQAVSQVKYTGWQNIDGKTYYFDKDGNKVTGTQIIQGAQYTFNSDGSLHTGSGILGIDVSTWNGNIDWSQVKNAGVSYVIIRTGFRGSTQGGLIEDAKFRQNIQGATAAGLKVGVYFFTQAINEVEAVEEASMVLSQISGYPITYPVFIDVEGSGGRADGLDVGTRTRVINAFCQTIQNAGYRAGIYANKTWLSQKMNISALSGYKIWLAQYNTEVTYGGKYDMWQYSEKGRIPGISTNVDMNLSYMSY